MRPATAGLALDYFFESSAETSFIAVPMIPSVPVIYFLTSRFFFDFGAENIPTALPNTAPASAAFVTLIAFSFIADISFRLRYVYIISPCS